MNSLFLYDVLLCGCAKDQTKIKDVANKLTSHKIEVHKDIWSINHSESMPQPISEGLDNSRVLLLFHSKNFKSEDWKKVEMTIFRFRDPQNKDRRFILVLLDQQEVTGPLSQFVNITSLQLQKDLSKLIALCSPPAPDLDLIKSPPPNLLLDLKIQRLILSYSLLKNDEQAYALDNKGEICIWNIKTGEYIALFAKTEHNSKILSLSKDERFLAADGKNNSVLIWDTHSGDLLANLKKQQGQILSMSWDNNENLIFLTDELKYIWRSSTDWISSHRNDLEFKYGKVISIYTKSNDCWVSVHKSNKITLHKNTYGIPRSTSYAGHNAQVLDVILNRDNDYLFSASEDGTIRWWNANTGTCQHVFEGHTSPINKIVLSSDEQFLLSCSTDGIVRLWDIPAKQCMQIYKALNSSISAAKWVNNDTGFVIAGNRGNIRQWSITELLETAHSKDFTNYGIPLIPQVHYTNAKVLVVGESGAGKTGLTERLALDTFTPTYSTSGTWSTQWKLEGLPEELGWQKEIWLWDFGGQADQRLIHQLYMDKTALILLVFNADQETIIPSLSNWRRALEKHVAKDIPTFLIAGRIDVGRRFSKEKVQVFAHQHGYQYFETSALDGKGCLKLKTAIIARIGWEQLEQRTTPVLWKILKDEILKIRDEGNQILYLQKELCEIIRARLPLKIGFTNKDIETVISLLDGPGILKELDFGTYVLLRPEWINIYAQAVIRTLRAAPQQMGYLPVSNLTEANLIFQTEILDGEHKEVRIRSAREEAKVLQAMEQMLLEKQLCLRQDGQLIFPAYFGIERPPGRIPGSSLISYEFDGYADDIYATLIVKLASCGAFELSDLWKDAATFKTLDQKRSMGIKLQRSENYSSQLLMYFDETTKVEEQVIFANYIHYHLLNKATDVKRQRYFFCPHCHRQAKDIEEVMHRLKQNGKNAKILCVKCEKKFSLWDELEELFASAEVKDKVRDLQQSEAIELNTRRLGKLLALEVMARITSADQKCFEIPGNEDEGIDIEVEFTNDEGRGTGKRYFLQLKSGNSHLQKRQDGTEVFQIKKQQWVQYWIKQPHPVFLVIGTVPAEERGIYTSGSKERFSEVRFMEIKDLLLEVSDDGKKAVKQIVFTGETLDVLAIRKWRDEALSEIK